MNSKFHFSILILLLMAISLIATSCSDDSTGPELEDEPQFPETTPAEVDKSYFDGADAGTTEEYHAFINAKEMAYTSDSMFQGYVNLGASYFNTAQTADANYENGMWVWEYTIQEGGASVTIKITAEQLNSGTEWNMYFSGTNPETGESVDEFRVMTGFVSSDGSSGEWDYYFTDDASANPILQYEWDKQSDDQFTLSVTLNDEESDEVYQMIYTKDGAENTINMDNFYQSGTVIVYWNDDTNTGYYDANGDRLCWNSQYVNTSCTELGY